MYEQSAVLDQPMAKKKPGRPKSDRDDVTVKIDRHVAKKLRYLADDKGITLAQLLTEFVRPIADTEFDKATRRN